MSQSSDAVMIAGSGTAYVAPTGSTLPTNVSTALDAAFIDLGYLTEDGATFRDEKTKEPIPAWQSFYPVKYVVTDASAEVEFVLRQWDVNTIPLAFGGGAITVASAGPPAEYVYTPPDPEEIDERAFVLEWAYDQSTFRLVVPKVMVTSGVESQLTRGQASDLPLTLGIIGTDGAAPWLMYSDHPEWV